MELKIIDEVPHHSKSGNELSSIKFEYVTEILKMDVKKASNSIRWKEVTVFKKPLTGVVYLSYPIDKVVSFEVKQILTIGELLWHVSQAYKAIYEKEELYGVWGHDIGDLVFEFISLYNFDTIIIPSMGS